MNIFKKNTEKHTEKLPMTGKVKKGFRIYCTAIMGAALVLGTSVTAFAANDPITVINNLSTFIFGLIRAIGLILLGFGVVQVGLSLSDAAKAGINTAEVPMYLLGVVTAAVSGYLCIRLLKYVADKGRFGAFAYYCWAVGILTLVLQAVK